MTTVYMVYCTSDAAVEAPQFTMAEADSFPIVGRNARVLRALRHLPRKVWKPP